MRKKKLAAMALIFLCLLPWAALGESGLPRLHDARIGDQGMITPGEETALTVTVENGSSPFQGALSVDVYENQYRFIRYEIPVSLAAHESAPFTIPFLPQSDQPEYTVILSRDQETVSSLSLSAAVLKQSAAADGAAPKVWIANESNFPFGYIADVIPVKNTSTAMPMMICLALYLAAGIAGGYFLLKKQGLRHWMWGLIPALALLCTFTISLLGRGQEYHTPAAVTLCVYDLDKDQTAAGAKFTGTGKADTQIAAQGLDLSLSSHSIDYNAWENPSNAQPELTARYLLEEDRQVILPADSPWKTTYLSINHLSMENIALSGMVQPDEKGISGYAENLTGHDFSLCVLFTPAGCTLLPGLKAGEKMEFSLPWAEDPTPDKINYEAGQLTLPLTRGTNYTMLYRLCDTIRTESWQNIPALQQFSDYSARSALVSLLERLLDANWRWKSQPCLFIGLTDTLGSVSLTADGREITRRGHLAIVMGSLTYQPAGEDGSLFYFPHSASPTLGALSENGPEDTLAEAAPVQLTDEPVILCYAFPGAQETAAQQLILWYDDSLLSHIVYAAYNFEKGEWMDLTGDSALFTDEAAAALMQEGKIYLQIRSQSGIYPDGDLQLPTASYLGRDQ